MRGYRLRPKAQNDLDEIWDYTHANWGRSQARTYIKKIKRACIRIASNPNIGKAREEILAGLHVSTVEKHMLCYFIDDTQIDVLRILYRRMDVESRIV